MPEVKATGKSWFSLLFLTLTMNDNHVTTCTMYLGFRNKICVNSCCFVDTILNM